MKGGIDVDHCPFCGSRLIKDKPTGLYECKACDTLYTINDDTITYLKNSTKILEQLMDDLKLMNEKKFF